MAGQTTSSKALIYLSERVEDATEAVKGLIGGSGSSKYLDNADDRISVIRSQLDSDRDDLRLEGLRTIIAMISKGRDASSYFPQVLKLSSNSNLEIRKLVYIIVRRYARRQPDVALLGINSFQRDLVDRSEVIRAMALRVLSGLQLPLVASVVEVAIAKCVKDSHFYVRKAAALSITKCFRTSPELKPALMKHLSTLLSDRHPVVLSAALVSYTALCPREWSMLHPNFRKICHALSDMDEWGQWNAIGVLGLYAKGCIAQPSPDSDVDLDLQLLFAKVKDLLMSRNAAVVSASIRLLLNLAPSTYHINLARPLVRLAQSSGDIAYFALITCLLLSQFDPALLRPYIHAFYLRSSMFESAHNSNLKLQILLHLSETTSVESIMMELCEQARYHSNEEVAKTAIEQIGAVAKKDPIQIKVCIKVLLDIVKDCNERDVVVAKAISVLQSLVRSCPVEETAVVISKLASLLFSPPVKEGTGKKYKLLGKGTLKSPTARASIFWLIGQYCRLEVKVKINQTDMLPTAEKDATLRQTETGLTLAEVIGGDILRRAATNFANESPDAKLQIITLSTKLYTFLPTTGYPHYDTIKLLHAYILQLARYDEDFDIRDRGRFCKALTDRMEVKLDLEELQNKGNTEQEAKTENLGGVILRRDQVLHILFEGKEKQYNAVKDIATSEKFSLDTLSYALGGNKLELIKEDYCLVDWTPPDQLPSPSVREPEIPPSSLSLKTLSQGELINDKLVESKASSGNVSPLPASVALSTTSSGMGLSKYKDLETFLDEESEEDEQGGLEEKGSSDVDESEEEEESDKQDEENATSSEEDVESDESSVAESKSKEQSRLTSESEEANEWAQ